MLQFFFHLQMPDRTERDEDGLAFPDLETAYLEACAALPDMAAEMLREGNNPLLCAFRIANAADETLMEVSFAERLHDLPAPRPRLKPAEQFERSRRLVSEITEAIALARQTAQASRALLAHARQIS